MPQSQKTYHFLFWRMFLPFRACIIRGNRLMYATSFTHAHVVLPMLFTVASREATNYIFLLHPCTSFVSSSYPKTVASAPFQREAVLLLAKVIRLRSRWTFSNCLRIIAIYKQIGKHPPDSADYTTNKSQDPMMNRNEFDSVHVFTSTRAITIFNSCVTWRKSRHFCPYGGVVSVSAPTSVTLR